MEKIITEEAKISYYEKFLLDGDFFTILYELTPLPENFYLTGFVIETNIIVGRLTEAEKILHDIVLSRPEISVVHTSKESVYLFYLQGMFAFEKGEHLKAKKYLEQAYDYLGQNPKHYFYYKVVFALIRCYIQTKDFNEAKLLLDLVQSNNLPLSEHNRMRVTFLLGIYSLGTGNWNTALEYLIKANALAEKFPNKADRCPILTNMSNLYRRKGDLKKAVQLLEETNELFKSIHNVLRQGITLLNIGILYLELGEYQQSLAYENLAIKIFEKFPKSLASASCLQVKSNNYYCLGKLEESYQYQKQCLDIVRELQDKKVLADTLENIGGLLLLQGKLYESRAVMEESLAIIETWGEKQEIGKRYSNFGAIDAELGDYKKALVNYYKAYDLHKSTGTPEFALETAIGIVEAYGELEDFSGFNTILSGLPVLPTQPAYLTAYKLIIDGIIAFYNKKFDEAKNLLEQALLVEGLRFTWQVYIYERLINIELAELNTKLVGGVAEVSGQDLAKIPALLASMELLTKNKHLTPALCKNYLLQAKFSLLYHDDAKARTLLAQASEIASTYGLPLYLKLIKKEEERMNSTNIAVPNNVKENTTDIKENIDIIRSYIRNLGKVLTDLAINPEK